MKLPVAIWLLLVLLASFATVDGVRSRRKLRAMTRLTDRCIAVADQLAARLDEEMTMASSCRMQALPSREVIP